jgi:hypothetical protein
MLTLILGTAAIVLAGAAGIQTLRLGDRTWARDDARRERDDAVRQLRDHRCAHESGTPFADRVERFVNEQGR